MTKNNFEKFYNTHFDKIYRFVFFRVRGNKELAEDLTSEIFIKALKNFNAYEEEKSKSAWIFTIARNHLANHFRDTGKRVEISLEAIDGETHIEIESQEEIKTNLLADGFEQLAKKDAERELLQALNKLSADARQLVTLKYLSGYSYKEIGEMLEMSEGAAKVAAYRAMKELKKYVSKI